MIKIVTFLTYDYDDVQALTVDEFVDDFNFSEWVWHLAPSKEAAIAAHHLAHEAWELLNFKFYDHSNPPQVRWEHDFELNFVLHSDCEGAEDVTGAQIRTHILQMLADLSDQELRWAVNCFDSRKVNTNANS